MLDTPEGFEVPVLKAPLKPKLMLGAPRDFTLCMVGLAIGAFLYKLWPLLPLAGFLQLGAIWGTRHDPQWFSKVWRVATEYARYYKA